MAEKEYIYFPNGTKKAVLVHTLNAGECSAKWEAKPYHFTQGKKVFLQLIAKDDPNFVFPTDLDRIK